MSWIQVRNLWVIGLEYRRSVTSVVWVDGSLLCGRIVPHVVEPSLPAWGDLFNLGWEKFSGISVFDPSSLVLAEMSKVFVVPVSENVCADERSYLI